MKKNTIITFCIFILIMICHVLFILNLNNNLPLSYNKTHQINNNFIKDNTIFPWKFYQTNTKSKNDGMDDFSIVNFSKYLVQSKNYKFTDTITDLFQKNEVFNRTYYFLKDYRILQDDEEIIINLVIEKTIGIIYFHEKRTKSFVQYDVDKILNQLENDIKNDNIKLNKFLDNMSYLEISLMNLTQSKQDLKNLINKNDYEISIKADEILVTMNTKYGQIIYFYDPLVDDYVGISLNLN